MDMSNYPMDAYRDWVKETDYAGPFGTTVKAYLKKGKADEYRSLAPKLFEKANSGGNRRSSEIHGDMANPSVVWFTEFGRVWMHYVILWMRVWRRIYTGILCLALSTDKLVS